MSQRTQTQYKALYGSSGTIFPDNTTADISEADMRQFGEDSADSLLFRANLQVPASVQATASGTDTYAATLSPAITSYQTGLLVLITFTNANSGASTLNLNTLGAKSIKKYVSSDLAASDISAGQVLLLQYDGTNFQVIGGLAGGGGAATWGSITGTLSSQTDLQAALDDIKNKQGFSSLYAL